jgi:hypothetical protein
MSKLAALVLASRVHLTRYHGVFAPNSNHRKAIILKPQEQVVVAGEPSLDTTAQTSPNRPILRQLGDV